MSGGPPNNRVTTAQFYEEQLKQRDRMSEMERRIVGKLDHISECLPKLENQVDTNKEEIEKLRKRSDIVDAVEGALMLVVSIFFGTKN